MSESLLKYPISFKIVKKEEERMQEDPLRNSEELLWSCQNVKIPSSPRAVPCILVLSSCL